jgi:uncharacterized protein YbjT (DUF2867 family)
MTILLLFLLYAVALSVALGGAGFRARPARGARAPGTPAGRILVVGATGGTGRELVTRGLGRGLEVTALVRDPARLGIEHPRLRVVRGDVLDPASLEDAVRDAGAVLCALGHRRYLGPSRILSAGTRNIVSAMERQGVRRLVCETSLGIGDSAGRMGLLYTFFLLPVVLPFYFWDKTRQEQVVAASGLDWVIVRPGALVDGPGRGRWRHGASVGSLLWTVRIARADVAEFMLDQVTSDDLLGTATGVCW